MVLTISLLITQTKKDTKSGIKTLATQGHLTYTMVVV